VLEGRALSERDTIGAPGVALVNEAFARETAGRVVGRRLRSGTPRIAYGNSVPNEFEIVGIVQNERFRGLEHPAQPAFYLSTRQFPQAGFTVIGRTVGDPAAATPDIRAAIRETDPAITFDRATSLAAILTDQLGSRRVTADVIGGFAAVALALAALGVYGLLAVLVGSGTREIGVRLAIGASPASVARQVLVSGVGNTAIGVSLGCLLAIAAGRFVQSVLVDVSPYDPLTLMVVATVLICVALAAGVAPARRAAHVHPVDALRAE
jgi:putative ABC transport system permease protein